MSIRDARAKHLNRPTTLALDTAIIDVVAESMMNDKKEKFRRNKMQNVAEIISKWDSIDEIHVANDQAPHGDRHESNRDQGHHRIGDQA